MWLSRTALWRGFDQFLVDRMLVGGTARLAQGLGWLGSRLQNGQVAFYVTLFTIWAPSRPTVHAKGNSTTLPGAS